MAGLWYRTGSVAVTQSSKKITGTGTSWLTSLNRPSKGNVFYGPDGKAYEIDYISSETELYLVDAYAGADATGQSYKIDVRGGTVPELSRQLSEDYAYMQGIIDSLQSIVSGSGDVTITGPSGQTVTVPALANMLSKSGNLSGLISPDTALSNLGVTPVGKAVAKAADAAGGRTALGLGEAATRGVGISNGAVVTRILAAGAGANVVYKRLATAPVGTSTTGDGLVEFLLSGAGNIAGITYPTYLVQFTSRRTNYVTRVFVLASQSGVGNPPSFFVYLNAATGNFELWCSAGPYLPGSLYIQPLAEFGGAVIDGATNAAAIPNGATNVTATAIHNLWSDKSLVKQTGPLDTTAGAILANGAWGLGSTAVDAGSDVSAAETRFARFMRILATATGAPATNATVGAVVLPIDSSPSAGIIAVGSRRGFFGQRASNGAVTWTEAWTKENLPSETGAFTPFIGGTTADGSTTHNDQRGYYVRIGNLVFVDVRIKWTATTATGNLIVAGLPFVSSVQSNGAAHIPMVGQNFASATTGPVLGFLGGGSSRVSVATSSVSGGPWGALPMTASGELVFSTVYRI